MVAPNPERGSGTIINIARAGQILGFWITRMIREMK